MNTCVKQKKLDEEGGGVSEGSRGLALVTGRVGGWAPVSDVCLVCQALRMLSFMCVCLCLSLCVPFTHTARYWGVKVGTPEGGRHIQTNHWSLWQSQELSVLLMSPSLSVKRGSALCCCSYLVEPVSEPPLVSVLVRFVTVTGSPVCTLPHPSGHRHRGTGTSLQTDRQAHSLRYAEK